MTNMQRFWVKLSPSAVWLLIASGPLCILVSSVVYLFTKGYTWFVILIFIALITLCISLTVWAQRMREQHIREAPFPRFLKKKLLETYPHFSAKDCDLVERGLRQFFLACSRSKKQFVAMPSKAVDAMWHEFILHTKGYEAWCSMALGYFLHHTPAEALGKKAKGNDGLRRAWYWTCKDEAIDPKKPSRLPLLFALDTKLAIAGGFSYLPDCSDIALKSAAGGDAYCGTSFSDGSFSSDSSSSGDFGGADASSGDGSGGDGGGDGGGCGGGGD
jgi:hypothetical protein